MNTYHYHSSTHRFDYSVVLKPRMQHRYIRIRDGKVIVTAPQHTPIDELHDFVTAKADWIIRHLQAHPHTSPGDLTREGSRVYRHGKSYPITLKYGTKDELKFEDGKACFTLKDTPADHNRMVSLLHKYYRQNAPELILPRLAYWAQIMDLHPTRITFRRARTRWGSCSNKNTLSLNIALVMLPDNLIDYVLIHELAHIRHKHHQKDFWDLVARYLPDWKRRRQALRRYETALI